MPKKKCKCQPGAPEWMVTYGDMVTLLLCFFVLIVSFSEIKKEDQFQAVVEEIKKAFGMRGGGGKLPTEDDPALSLIERLESIRMRQERVPNKSNVKDPGQSGREPRVTTIREGKRYAVGGKILFEPESAELTEESKKRLIDLVSRLKLKDSANKIELAGHAAAMELIEPGTDTSMDRMRLSTQRAAAVMRFLIGDEVPAQYRLEKERFTLISNGDAEPIEPRGINADEVRDNRRVEIIVTENVVQDYQGNQGGPEF
ncbi:MAG: flagellar motor protein MotB [Phycisphaeraceae bacterium]